MLTIPALPYPKTGLAPYISEETLNYHYGKHHQTYVNKLNELIKGTELADKSLEDIILTSSGTIFNNAAQIWNHTFYWESLSDKHDQQPSGELLTAIETTFESLESFIEQFSTQAATLFGSGWVWLVMDKNNTLSIVQTQNADLPMTQGMQALLTCDVWEHAYYLDTQNARPQYIENFWHLVNWEKVSERYKQALDS